MIDEFDQIHYQIQLLLELKFEKIETSRDQDKTKTNGAQDQRRLRFREIGLETGPERYNTGSWRVTTQQSRWSTRWHLAWRRGFKGKTKRGEQRCEQVDPVRQELWAAPHTHDIPGYNWCLSLGEGEGEMRWFSLERSAQLECWLCNKVPCWGCATGCDWWLVLTFEWKLCPLSM